MHMRFWGNDLLGWALLLAGEQCDLAVLDAVGFEGLDAIWAKRGGCPNFEGQHLLLPECLAPCMTAGLYMAAQINLAHGR